MFNPADTGISGELRLRRRPGNRLARIRTWVLRPFTLSQQLRDERRARRRLAEALANRRAKDSQVRVRLAQLEAERDAQANEAQTLFEALTAERRKLRLEQAEVVPWATAAMRANALVRERSADLDRARGEHGAELRGLAGAPPPLKPSNLVPLRLAIAGRAPTVFSLISDPGVIARHVGDPLSLTADALIFPHAEDRTYVEDASEVPDAIWDRVRQGLAKLVLDASSEGMAHTAQEAHALHAFLRDRGVEPSNTLYLTQDRRYPADYEAWCAAEGLAPMRTRILDSYVFRVLREFQRIGSKVFEQRLAAYLRRPAERERRFVCLNYTLRPLKILFLLRLMCDGLWDQGWISSGGFGARPDEDAFSRHALTKRLLATEGFADEVKALLPLMDRLEAMKTQLFIADDDKASGKRRSRIVRAGDLEPYRESWFTVVTETEMSPRLHRITEKPLKPLLAFHPFLIVGNPGSLGLLRGYGFETFSGVFDERYDEELDPRRRFDMVYDEVRRLCAMDEAQMARTSAALSEIVTFNACWGLTELPRRFNETVLADLIDELGPRTPAP